MATKLSIAGLLGALITWLVSHQPIVDYVVLTLTTLVALLLLAWSAAKRNRKVFLAGAVPWLALGIFFHIAAQAARIEVGSTLDGLASVSRECGSSTCISMMASGTPYSVAGTRGFLVEAYGAAIYVKIFVEAGECRAHEDELIGRARHVEWSCTGGDPPRV